MRNFTQSGLTASTGKLEPILLQVISFLKVLEIKGIFQKDRKIAERM
jgi:hypothetical protein